MWSPEDIKRATVPNKIHHLPENKTMPLNAFYCGKCALHLIPIYFQPSTSFKMP